MKFIISHLDQQIGPFSEQELKTKWVEGEILPIDYVYDETKKDWILMTEQFAWTKTLGAHAEPPPIKKSLEKVTPPPPKKQEPIVAPILNPPLEQFSKTPEPDLEVTNLNLRPAQEKSAGTDIKIVNGVGVIDLPSVNAGVVELVLHTDDLIAREPLKINVRALQPSEIVWFLPEQLPVGESLSIQIKALDERGGLCSHHNDHFLVQSEGQEWSVEMTNGQGSLKITNTKAGHWELKLRGQTQLKLPSVAKMEWLPGPAARLIMDAPADMVAGNSLQVQVKAVDQYGNVARTFDGTVRLEVKAG